MQDLTSQNCVSNQNGCRTHHADLYKVISDASLNFISSVHRDTAYHENSQQEMNFAIEIVDMAVSRRIAKDAAATLFESQRAHLRERLEPTDQDGPCPLGSIGGALWIARRLFQFINGLVLFDFNVRPFWGSCVQRILCLVKATSFQSSEPTSKSRRDTFSFPPVPNRSSTNRLIILPTDYPAAGLPAVGSSVFSNESVNVSFMPLCCAMAPCIQSSQRNSIDP